MFSQREPVLYARLLPVPLPRFGGWPVAGERCTSVCQANVSNGDVSLLFTLEYMDDDYLKLRRHRERRVARGCQPHGLCDRVNKDCCLRVIRE